MDYLARWLHKSRNEVNVTKNPAMKDIYERAIRKVDDLIASIPAEAISKRAVLCGSHARALFHYEAHIREVQSKKTFTECNEQGVDKEMLVQLQNIYAQIDEPDGIDGISAHLHVLDIDQQILGHQKAGRWTAVQSWFEIKLEDDPLDVDSEVNLMDCLKQSGQYGMYPQSGHCRKRC
jgi:serine/threonine-protein kinase ATR